MLLAVAITVLILVIDTEKIKTILLLQKKKLQLTTCSKDILYNTSYEVHSTEMEIVTWLQCFWVLDYFVAQVQRYIHMGYVWHTQVLIKLPF